MAQTIYGSGGFRGLADENSAGLYVSSMSQEATEELVEVLDHAGEVIGLSMGNRQSNLDATGVTVTAGTQGQTLGSTMSAIANSALYATDYAASPVYYVHSVRLERQNQQWENGSFQARSFVGLTDTTPA